MVQRMHVIAPCGPWTKPSMCGNITQHSRAGLCVRRGKIGASPLIRSRAGLPCSRGVSPVMNSTVPLHQEQVCTPGHKVGPGTL